MKTNQPEYKLVAQLGDKSPINYGGYFVYEDTTGVYPPQAEVLIAPDSDAQPESEGPWTVYRFNLEPCTWINGVLSDNKFHPEMAAWFAKPESERAARPQDTTYLKNVADCMGTTGEELVAMFTTGSTVERAQAWQMVGEYHGWENLDSYPLTFTDRAEVEARYADELKAKL